jgi:FG-GAP-like repeat
MPSPKFSWLAGTTILLLAALLSTGVWLYQHGVIASQRARAEQGSPVAARVALSEEDRKFLWDVEHWVFTMDHKVLPRFATALMESDEASILQITADDFRGQILEADDRTAHRFDFGDFVRLREAESDKRETDPVATVGYLMNYRTQFGPALSGKVVEVARFFTPEHRGLLGEPPRIQVALMQFAPEQRDRFDGPWRGSMKVRLCGRTRNGDVAEVVLKARIRVDAPTEDMPQRSGWLHEFLVYSVDQAQGPDFLMAEVAASRGLDCSRYKDNWTAGETASVITGAVNLCDYNDDGWIDVLVTDIKNYALYSGGPNGFRDVTEQAGLAGYPELSYGPACFADLDNDGWEDLLLGNRVFRNLHNGTFLDVTAQTNLRLDTRGTYVIADYDGDGLVDVYVAVASMGMTDGNPAWLDDTTGGGNQLWHNHGGWNFSDVTAETGTEGEHRSCFTATWLDANDDGRPDLALPDEFGRQLLLINRGPGKPFEPSALHDGFGGFAMGMVAGDIDNDGRIDLYTATMYSKAGERIVGNLSPDAYPPDIYRKIHGFCQGNDWFHNDGSVRFSRRARASEVANAGWAYGPSLPDLNNDGLLDVYVPCGFQSVSRDAADG